jgi:serine protease
VLSRFAKAFVSGRHVRLAAGATALAATAALGLSGATSASASPEATHGTPATHVLKTRSYGPALAGGNLINHGGPVQTGARVYVVYWGWVSDPSGEQTYLNNFLSSISGNSWLQSVPQYGASTSVSWGGAWSDSASVPSHPTDSQIQAEAAKAASHFGASTSVNTQIVVATPTGHSTSGFGTQWCAYHGAISSRPNNTYTDLPYMTDAGGSCGAGSVTGRALDGVSIVEGHELAEAITDPLLNAWYDSSGQENADKCAWTGLHTITTSKGTFAVQPLWSNSAGRCVG